MNAGGVGFHAPTPVNDGRGATASELSAARELRTCLATNVPQSMPLRVCGRSGMASSVAASTTSNRAAYDGNKVTITSWPAAAAAASIDALRGTVLGTRYGARDRSIPL